MSPNNSPAMCGYAGEDSKPLRAADLARLASERAAQLRAEGEEISPVVCSTRKLAENFWGSAWMRHLALCEEGGFALSPGRTLLRHGCVLDLHIAPGSIRALISAQDLYEVQLSLPPLTDEQAEELRAACAGNVGSLVALLEGKANADLLHTLCDAETGLLPNPGDWKMSCSCPDWSTPCPHAAAAIYAAGVLIDRDPSLLFTLRSLDPALLIAPPTTSVANSSPLDPSSLEKTFGIKIDL